MSWIERELKKRTVQARRATPVPAASEAARMEDLWRHFEETNERLPRELQLRVDASPSLADPQEGVQFLAWLLAPNGAAIGFSGDAIRYVWPEMGRRKSNNFWILWDAERQSYVVNQRVSASSPPTYERRNFDERRAVRMVKSLVLGKRVKATSVLRRRFWLF